jgi:hypothetical protein
MFLQVFDPRMAPIWLAARLGSWSIGRRREQARARWVWAFAALAAINAVIYWGIIPYRTQQRFLFPAVGMAAVPVAMLLDRAKLLRVVGVVLLALHTMTGQAWPWARFGEEQKIPWDFSPMIPNTTPGPIVLPMPSTDWGNSLTAAVDAGQWAEMVRVGSLVYGPWLIGLLAFWAAAMIGRALNRPTQAKTKGAAWGALAALLVIGGMVTAPWGMSEPLRFFPVFVDYFRGWLTLDRLSGPDGARVAYAGTNLPYFLLGPGMKNRVRYVNVNEHRDWLMHDYHREAVAAGRPNWPGDMPGWDREEQDYDAWLANLRADRIELLVVARHNVGETWPIERQWAERHPDQFTPLYGQEPPDPLFRIYRVGRR